MNRRLGVQVLGVSVVATIGLSIAFTLRPGPAILGCCAALAILWAFFSGQRALVFVAGLVIFSAACVEELYASAADPAYGASFAPIAVKLGFQIYDSSALGLHIATLTIIALFVAVVLAVRLPHVGLPRWAVGTCAAWALSAGLMSALRGESAIRIGQAMVPALVVLAGLILGAAVSKHSKAALRVLLITLAYKIVLLALWMVGLLPGAGTRFVLFYDSVTPTIAAAFALALILQRRWRGWDVVFLAAALSLVMLGERRTPVLTIAIVGILLPLISGRLSLWARVAAGAIAAVLVIPAQESARLVGAVSATAGQGVDESTTGHLRDLVVGADYLMSPHLAGIGFNAPQLPGLAANQAARLYVHDEYLHTAIAAGIIPAIFQLVLILSAAAVAVRSLRGPLQGADIIQTGLAAFLLLLPVTLVLFPYLSTTTRWPLLTGVAMGYFLANQMRQGRSRVGTDTRAGALDKPQAASAPSAPVPAVGCQRPNEYPAA